MNTPIKTNKLVYKLNYNEIDKKFDIFAVKTSKKYFEYGAYILDVPAMDRNVKRCLHAGWSADHLVILCLHGRAKSFIRDRRTQGDNGGAGSMVRHSAFHAGNGLQGLFHAGFTVLTHHTH